MMSADSIEAEVIAGTVLIVDDTPTNLGVVVESLEDFGFKVLIAQDGEEGLMRAALVQPDLILLDVMMPGLDGWEVCRRLKAQTSTQAIPVIFMTSLADTSDKLNGFRAGGVDYVVKPFQIEEVLARVTTHINLRNMQKQLEAQNEELQRYREHLEQQVSERTAELSKSNLWLREEIEERKNANERLELMDFALNHVTEAAYLIDESGHFFYVNAEACRVLGYSREELLGMELSDIDPAFSMEDWPARWEALKDRWQKPSDPHAQPFERTHRSKQGHLIPVEINSNYFEYKGSGYTLALARDITERKVAERRLQDQTLWLQTLLLTIPDPVWVKDMKGTFISCNGAFSKIFDRSVEETLGRCDADFIDAERANFFLQKDREAAEAGHQVVNEEWIKYLPDGRPVLWETVKTPLYDAAGNLVGVLGVARDITERKRLEDELRAKDQYQRALLDNFPFMVWLKDTDSRLLAVNKPYVEAAGGNSTDEFFGKTDLDYWPREMAEAYRADDFEVLRTGLSKAVEERLAHQDGIQWIETYKAPVVVDGRLLGTVGFARDITAEKAAQHQLRLLNYALDCVGESAYLINPQDLTFLYVNQTAAMQLGYSREELVSGMSVFDIDPDWTMEKHKASLVQYTKVTKGSSYFVTFESRHRTKDGRVFPVEIVSNVFEFDGQRYRLSVCRDISERKLAQQALQKSEQRYREIFDNASECIYMLEVTEDNRFRYLEVNPAFENSFGLARNSAVGRYAGFAGTNQASNDAIIAKFRRCLESKKPHEEEIELSLSIGQRTFHTTLIPLFNSNGEVDRIIGMSHDITARKRQTLLETARSAMLERLAEGKALSGVLALIAEYIQKLHPEFICSIMTMDESGTFLRVGTGSSLPQDLLAAYEGIALGQHSAPCTHAVSYGETVIAEDVRKHPYGAPYKHLTLQSGLLSCWSVPIFDSLGKVCGTLDIHRSTCGHPTEENLALIRQATHLAAMAIERKRLDETQQKRLELEQRLSRLAAHAPGMMYIYRQTPQGKATFPFVSPIIEKLFGIAPDIAATDASLLFDRAHPDDRQRIIDSTRISALGLLPFHCDFRVMHPSKGEIWLEARSTPEREPDGSTLWHGFMHDITERKQAEALLHQREQEFRSLAENSPDVIARLDTQGRYVYVNSRLQKVVGLSAEEILGKRPTELRDIPELRELEAKAEEALQGWDTEMFYSLANSRNGLSIHDHVRFAPEYDSEGNVTSVLLIGRDIRQIKETERQLRSLVENIPDFIMRFDPLGHYLYVSPAVLKAFDTSQGDYQGRTALEIPLQLSPEMRRYLHENVLQAAKGTPSMFEALVPHESGERVFDMLLVPERDEFGSIVSVLTIGRDITQIKVAMHELRRSEALLRSLIDSIPDLIFFKDTDSVYLGFNTAFAEYCGRSEEELQGKTDEAFASPEIASAYRNSDRIVLESGESRHNEEWITYPDGRQALLDTLKTPLHDADGNIIGIIGICRDITERKRMEQELVRREREFRTLAENSPNIIVRYGQDFRRIYYNRAYMQSYNISAEEDLGKTPLEQWRLATPDAQTYMQRLQKIMHTGVMEELIVEQMGTDGLPLYRNMFLVPEPDENGKVVNLLAISHDITGIKRMEALLRKSELEFRTLAENSPDMIVRYDQDCRRIYLNPAYEYYTGIPLDRARNKNPAEVWVPMMPREEYVERLQRVMQTGQPDRILLEWILPDGSLTSHQMHAVAEYDDQGRAVGTLVIGHNISELKATERRLEESRAKLQALTARREAAREEERKRIAREMHDELGQRLTALRMDVSVLRLRFGQDNPELIAQVKNMMKSVDSTIQVVRNVAARLRPATLDMGIASALEWLTEEFVNRSGIACDLCVDTENVQLDDNQATAVFRIVQESLTNVTRHAKAENVDISLRRFADHYLLTIRDDGQGFDPKAQRHKSFGLMGIEERILMLGGELQMQSSLGKGTTITARIPLHKAQEES